MGRNTVLVFPHLVLNLKTAGSYYFLICHSKQLDEVVHVV